MDMYQKKEMRKNKIPENLIEEANTYYETDDEEILKAREKFNELEKKYHEEIKEEKEKVIAAGGLKIIGTERHESRRIDNQLRGRSGRQGDPGESKFYISLDDDLIKIFGENSIINKVKASQSIQNIPIEHKMITNLVETAQKRIDISSFIKENSNSSQKIIEELQKEALSEYEKKEQEIGADELREMERVVMLKVVDQKWMDHIDAMDELKDGIGLRAYGQQDPVVKYRIEGMDMFEEMVLDIKHDVVQLMMNVRKQDEVKREETAKITGAALQNLKGLDADQSKVKSEVNRTVVNSGPKVGRNDPCPCGSGKKYKNCCGK